MAAGRRESEVEVTGSAGYENAEKAKEAYLNQLTALRKAIAASHEAAAEIAALQQLLDDHLEAIKRIAQKDLEKTLLAQQAELTRTFIATLKVAASREVLLPILTVMQTMQKNYAILHTTESRILAINYLYNSTNKKVTAENKYQPSDTDVIALANPSPSTPPPTPTTKTPNLAEKLMKGEIPEIRNDKNPKQVTTYKNNTFISNSAKDAVAAVIAAGWGNDDITLAIIPKKNPKLILDTLAALILNGVHVIVPAEVRVRLLKQLDKDETKHFFTLMHLSDCIKEIKQERNTAFDDCELTNFSKLMLKASEFSDAENLHAELLDIFTSTEESFTIIQEAVRNKELNGIDLRVGNKVYEEVEDYILALLPGFPSKKRAEMKARFDAEKINREKRTNEEKVTQFKDANNLERAKIIIDLMKDYKKNQYTIDHMLGLTALSATDRTTIMNILHGHYFDKLNDDFSKIITKDMRQAKQPSIEMSRVVPTLLKSVNAKDLLDATNPLREAAFEEFNAAEPPAEPGVMVAVLQAEDHEKIWRKFLAKRNFISSYESASEKMKEKIIMKFIDNMGAMNTPAERAIYYVGYAGTFVTEYFRSHKTLLQVRFQNTETAIIHQYIEMYKKHPCPGGLKYIATCIGDIVKNMRQAEKDSLVNNLEFDIYNLSPAEIEVMGVLAKNGIRNASPNKIYYQKLDEAEIDDLNFEFNNRITSIIRQPDAKARTKMIKEDIEIYIKMPIEKLNELLNALFDFAKNDANKPILLEIYQQLIGHHRKLSSNFIQELSKATTDNAKKALIDKRIYFYVLLERIGIQTGQDDRLKIETEYIIDETREIIDTGNGDSINDLKELPADDPHDINSIEYQYNTLLRCAKNIKNSGLVPE